MRRCDRHVASEQRGEEDRINRTYVRACGAVCACVVLVCVDRQQQSRVSSLVLTLRRRPLCFLFSCLAGASVGLPDNSQ